MEVPMPIYEYRRPDGTTFEVQQSFSEDALAKDPETGVPVERVLHAPAVHFKGKGFYSTDYGTRNREREAAASEGSSANGSAPEGSASDRSAGDSPAQSSKDAKTKDETGSSSGAGKDAKKPTPKPVAAEN
jgi:putative FmdB family regulatory protein